MLTPTPLPVQQQLDAKQRLLALAVGVAVGLATPLAALVPLGPTAASAQTKGPAKGSMPGPPQHLPLIAQWCLVSPHPTCIDLEVALTPQQQLWGLQRRAKLPPLRGMWFPTSTPTPLQFWMHLTPEPLDMLFISQQQVVAVVHQAKPCMELPCPSYGPAQAVDGVIELAGGEATRLHIGVGTPVLITPMPGPTTPSGR